MVEPRAETPVGTPTAPAPRAETPYHMGVGVLLLSLIVMSACACALVHAGERDWDGDPGKAARALAWLAGLGLAASLLSIAFFRSPMIAALGAAILAGAILLFPSHDARFMDTSDEEGRAVEALRSISEAQALFRLRERVHAPTLEALAEAGLLPPPVGQGMSKRYRLRILAADEFSWSAAAWPVLTPCCDTRRHFFVDESGVIRFSTPRAPATSLDTAIGG